MGFRQKDSEGRGGYARIWKTEDKGNYTVVQLSTSRKRKDTNMYETDFQDGFVRFVGNAHDKVKDILIPAQGGYSIQIAACEVSTSYNAETKKKYINYVVYDFDTPDANNNAKPAQQTTTVPDITAEMDDDDLPF